MDIVIIDDFYKDPDAVRKLALNVKYRDVTMLNYPGFQSLQTYASDGVRQKFQDILGRGLNVDPARHTFGKFRVMLKETGSRLKVHLDGASDWTGVLYLNPKESCEGGTGFYRHKATGLEGRADHQTVLDHGFKSWDDMEYSLISADTLNPDAWEEVSYVGMKFNRLVLFKGNNLFHCHTHSFGDNLLDGRMTQNFFFDED